MKIGGKKTQPKSTETRFRGFRLMKCAKLNPRNPFFVDREFSICPGHRACLQVQISKEPGLQAAPATGAVPNQTWTLQGIQMIVMGASDITSLCL